MKREPEEVKSVLRCASCSAAIVGDAAAHICVHAPLIDDAEQDRLIGTTLHERYKVISQISSGGWAKVYQGEQLSLGKNVAIKVLRTDLTEDRDKQKRFELEATSVSRLDHRHIARVLDYGMIDGRQPYIVMELLAGPTLTEVLDAHGYLSPEIFRRTFANVISALACAHSAGIIHRDLKPSNMMFSTNDLETSAAKILDFGVAKATNEFMPRAQISNTGDVLGTPQYMSPEQISAREIDARTDIYSLGCIMYECARGKRPFDASNAYDLFVQHCQEQPESIEASMAERNFPPDLSDLIMKCLAKDPQDRFSSAEELGQAFEEVWTNANAGQRKKSKSQKRPASAAGKPSRQGKSPGRNLPLIVVSVASIAGLAMLGLAVFTLPAARKGSVQMSLEQLGRVTDPVLELKLINEAVAAQKSAAVPDLKLLTDLELEKASVYERCGHTAEAAKIHNLLVDDIAKRYSQEAPQLLTPLAELSKFQTAHGDWPAAIKTNQRRLAIMERNRTGTPADRAQIMLSLARGESESGAIPQAEKHIMAADGILMQKTAALPKELLALSSAVKAKCLLQQGQAKDARAKAEEAYNLGIAAPENETSLEALEVAASVLSGLGKENREMSCLRKTVHLHRMTGDRDSAKYVAELFRIGQIAFDSNQLDIAAKYLKFLPKIAESAPAPLQPQLKQGLELYAEVLSAQGQATEASKVREIAASAAQRKPPELPPI